MGVFQRKIFLGGGGDKSEGAAREYYRGSQKRSVVEVEGVVPHVARRYHVHDKDTL